MQPLIWPILFALAVWWLSTGLILYLDGLPRHTFSTTLTVATALMGAALWGLHETRFDSGPTGAYCAFSCALLVWAWQELAFLLGAVTGPNRLPCPPGLGGWARTRLALLTVLHHEIALVVLAVAVAIAVGDGSNRIGWWTYLALWVMRQSAKLNLFLGARNLSEAFLPEHLRYLHSYFRRRAMNHLFPVSMLASTGAAALVWNHALALQANAPQAAGLALVGTLLALGALEHALLVLPLQPEALWRWGLRSPPAAASPAAQPTQDLP